MFVASVWPSFLTLFGIVVEYIILFKHIKNVESRLPSELRNRLGELNILGYGLLEDADSQELQDRPIFSNNSQNNSSQAVKCFIYTRYYVFFRFLNCAHNYMLQIFNEG